MFQQINQTDTFGIDTYIPRAAAEDKQLSPLQLRALWLKHLINEQEQLNKDEESRSPLTLELRAKHFLPELDDQSIPLRVDFGIKAHDKKLVA
jgi:hypothetical protein